jgi:hypothetical protein
MVGLWSPGRSALALALSGALLFGACGDSGSIRAPEGPSSAGAGGGTTPPITPQEPGATIPGLNENFGGAAGLDPLCGSGECTPDEFDCDDEELACRLESVEGEPIAVCAVAGPNRLDEPCFSASDCQAGYACIGGGLTGRCRPFCCHGPSSCDALSGTYCSHQPQRVNTAEESLEEPLIVPVCIPADDCDLTDPYPCPVDRNCGCPEGKACVVVRTADADQNPAGSTACVEPGPGKVGESCPIEDRTPRMGEPEPKVCGHGLVCSRATGKCIELCSTLGVGTTKCSGLCQASPALPVGWGICIEP